MTVQDYVITITDNTSTETLTSSPFGVLEYIPNPPDPDSIDSLTDEDVVSEQIRIRVADGSVANNIDEVNGIEKLLNRARKAQKDPNLASSYRVYLTFKNSAAGTQYQSEIVAGRIEWDEEVLSRAQWVTNVQVFTMFITRRWFWEATTPVQIPLTNGQGTDNISGLAIYNPNPRRSAATIAFVSATKKITDSGNGLAIFKTGDTIWVSGSANNDGSYVIATGGVAGEIVTVGALVDEAAGPTVTIVGPLTNYVEVKAADVTGVVNAPILLQLTNAAGASVTYKDIHIGSSRMENITNFVFTLEGEDGTGGSVVDTESGTSSGGYYCAVTWAGDTETEAWTYPLTANMLSAARGNYFLAIARLAAGTIATSIQLRLRIKLSTTVIYEGPLVTLVANEYMQELGAIQLPPYLEGITSSKALTLSLMAKKTGGGTINLDFIQLMPVESYRFLHQMGYAVPDGDRVDIDELNRPKLTYGVNSSQKYGVWIPRGEPLKVQPATLQRFYFLYDESDNTLNIDRKMTAIMYYKPRRLTL